MNFEKLDIIMVGLENMDVLFDESDLKAYEILLQLEVTAHNVELIAKFSKEMSEKYC